MSNGEGEEETGEIAAIGSFDSASFGGAVDVGTALPLGGICAIC